MVKVLQMLVAVLAIMAGPQVAVAQNNPFGPALYVNNKVITNYEVAQRRALLEAFRTAGDLDQQAEDGLIDDRLRLTAAEQLDLLPEEEAITAGMEEFAGRANLSTEQFLQAIGQAGVSEESFRDFITAGVAWRAVVRTRFGPRGRVTEAEVDRALALSSQRGGAEVLISEIILPANTPAAAARAEQIAAQIKNTVTTTAGFSGFARRFSASPSRGAGGRVANPIPIGNLPPAVASQIVTLPPGGVTDPIPVPNAIAVFQLRELRETGIQETENISLEYAQYFIPGGRTDNTLAQAQKIAMRIDTCDDLYGIAKGQPEERLVVETQAITEVPTDVAMELAKLDEGESSTALTRGNALMFLMLCGRTPILEEEVSRGRVRDRLVSQRVASFADGYLAELKANAIIRRP
ncbi:peptidylprolyl isomerase [Actibacterium sp. 188UL27-1]|uniref:peptidylprolyl isomerase n=1 Tax=Actibacterium sp. 188UL27-1 TaxID=2786961 RepID=UPI001EF66578|nr:peptidylprolyl isomerase [Actibacterium sp. 188UL27-1]